MMYVKSRDTPLAVRVLPLLAVRNEQQQKIASDYLQLMGFCAYFLANYQKQCLFGCWVQYLQVRFITLIMLGRCLCPSPPSSAVEKIQFPVFSSVVRSD